MNKTSLPSFLNRISRRVFFWRKTVKTEELKAELSPDHALVMAVTSPERIPHLSQLRYAIQLFSPNERRLLLVACLVLTLSLGAAGFALVKSHTALRPAVGGTYTEALIGQPKYLNPLDAVANDPDRDLVKLVYSGLFRHEGLETVPDLAESYTWSDDNKTLTVKLRQDAQFHDAQAVTAEDVQFTYEAILDPARKSPLAAQFRDLKIETQDEQTVVFHLAKSDVNFLSRLTIGILPAHLWQDMPATSARLSDLNLKPVGSGPYLVKSFTRDSQGSIHSFTLERSDKFYGAKPFIKTVVFQFFTDRKSALDAFKSGLVDSVAFINATDIDKIGSSQRFKSVKLELPQETVAFFNLKDKKLAVKEVRQALSIAVNRSEIVTAFNNSAVPVSSPFPFDPVDASTTATNLEQARELLTKAGWTMPQNGNVRIWTGVKKTTATAPSAKKTSGNSKTNKTTTTTETASSTPAAATTTELTLTILYPDDPDLENAAESLKRQWSLIGAHVTAESMPMEDLLHVATRERTSQIILLNIFIGPEQDLTPFWWSGGAAIRSLNISGLSNRDADDALQAIQSSTSTETLTKTRAKLTAVLADVLPAIFLVRPLQHYLISNNVNGASDGLIIADPFERLNDIVHWYTKTSWRWK